MGADNHLTVVPTNYGDDDADDELLTPVEIAREYFEEHTRATVENTAEGAGYIDLTFDAGGFFGAGPKGVYKSHTRELIEEGVVVAGFQTSRTNDDCHGDARVWFERLDLDVSVENVTLSEAHGP